MIRDTNFLLGASVKSSRYVINFVRLPRINFPWHVKLKLAVLSTAAQCWHAVPRSLYSAAYVAVAGAAAVKTALLTASVRLWEAEEESFPEALYVLSLV